MPGDFAVQYVQVKSANRLDVRTTVPGESVDGADPGDCLSPGCWVLTGENGRSVAMVATPVASAYSTDWVLYLTAELLPKSTAPTATLALAPYARASLGHAVDITPYTFSIPEVLPVVDAVPGITGSDVVSGLVGNSIGDLAIIGNVEALKARIRLMVSTSVGNFKHLPDFGRGVEPKRTYSSQKLQAEAARMKASIANDPEVKNVSIDVSSAGGVATFEIKVVPRTGVPFVETKSITAGVFG